jgi:hypothetical protein
MALTLMILITVLLGTSVIVVYGKADLKRIFIQMLILFIGDFILLYAKFVVGNDFLTFVFYLPAVIMLLIALIWLIIILIKMIARKESKKRIFAILLSFIMTTVIIVVPSLTQIDKFKLYQQDYFVVSDSLFKAYDEGKIAVGSQFQSPPYSKRDLEELKKIFSDKVINKMKALNRNAGVNTYIVAEKDLIYFSFGATFQSIDGIAISRKTQIPTDNGVRREYFQNVQFEYITDGVYYFTGGL